MIATRSQEPFAAPGAREIRDLRDELARARAERNALDLSSNEANPEIKALLDRQIDLLSDTLEIRVALARVQSSPSWRLLEAMRRQKLALRRIAMRWRGRRLGRPWRRHSKLPAFVSAAPLGVNVAGYLNTESGMGEAARLSIRSLEAAGIPVSLNNVASRLRMLDRTYLSFTDANPHPFNLVHLNADNMEWFARSRGRQYFRDRYTIGYWFWELAQFRPDWMSAFRLVDEVWVPSEFGREALADRSPVPLICVPLPVVVPSQPMYRRSHFGLPDEAFVFLFTFDVSSQLERKNPLGVIAAFRAAFATRRDVLLVLKFTNGEYDPAGVRELYRAAEGISAVLLEGYMEREELAGLMAAADSYVSLHRSEGFGLGLAEAMAIGKPVVATNYSGPADFLTAANSYRVDYRLTPIPRDYGPYLEGFTWAEPDIDQASVLMRRVVDAPSEAAARGRQAATDIAESRAPARTGARVRARLEEVRRLQ
jgi:glycosyltransferase involved in cell wall biosynthesis